MLFVQGLGEIGLLLGWSPTVAACSQWNPTQGDGVSSEEGWRTYGMRGQNCTRKDFLDKRHSLLSHFFISFTWQASLYCEECVCICVCVCTHISDCVRVVYELPLLPNNNTNETFLHKSGMLRSVYWIFVTGVPAWRWLGEYLILDKMFYNLRFKQEVVAAPVTAKFSSLLHSSRKPLLEIYLSCALIV
jgi:hypothetical protein